MASPMASYGTDCSVRSRSSSPGQAELAAAKTRASESEEATARLEAWAHKRIAEERATYHRAVERLMDRAARLTREEASALTAAVDARDQAQRKGGAPAGGTPASAAGAADAHGRQHGREPSAAVVQAATCGVAGTRDVGAAAAVASAEHANQAAPAAPAGHGAGAGAGAAPPGAAGGGSAIAAGESGAASGPGLAETEAAEAERASLRQEAEEAKARLELEIAARVSRDDSARRELRAAQRWAGQLEAQLDQTRVSLELEREELGAREEEIRTLQQRVAAYEDIERRGQRRPGAHSMAVGAGGAGGSPTGGAVSAAAGTQRSPSRRVARAHAVGALTIMLPDDSSAFGAAAEAAGKHANRPGGEAKLVVGQPHRPEEIALRPTHARGPPPPAAMMPSPSSGLRGGSRRARSPAGGGGTAGRTKARAVV